MIFFYLFYHRKCVVRDLGARLNVRGVEQPVVAGLYVDDTVLLAESEGDLQRVVNEFYSVCKRRKIKMNAGKSKVMVFERREEEVVDFNTAYSVRLPAVARCRVMLGIEKMEEMSEFKYLGTALCKHGRMENEIRERLKKKKKKEMHGGQMKLSMQ